MKDFKIRCSAIGQIMTSPKSKTDLLSKTTQTYLDEWAKEQIYSRRKLITTKYMDKGNVNEDQAIEFVSTMHPEWPLLIKNSEYFEDDFMTGTPDLVFDGQVIDIKCSWDCFTFPLFENYLPEKSYYWQLQGYFNLTGAKKGRIIYVLTDTPEEQVNREIKYNPEKEDEIIAYHSYRGIKDELKIKEFEVLRNDDDIDLIRSRVKECRQYLTTIL